MFDLMKMAKNREFENDLRIPFIYIYTEFKPSHVILKKFYIAWGDTSLHVMISACNVDTQFGSLMSVRPVWDVRKDHFSQQC